MRDTFLGTPGRRGGGRFLAVAPLVVLAMAGGYGIGPAPVHPGPGWPAHPNWQTYVQGPSSPDVAPVSVAATSGRVTDAEALVTGHGSATLTMTVGGGAPSILLDYGKDLGGAPYFNVRAVSGSPTLRGAFSEARSYLTPTGDQGGAAGDRYGDVTPAAPGTYTLSPQGGERFELVTLTSPGTVRLSAAGIQFEAYRAAPDDYQGYFVSSSQSLNQMWYDGAYTTQLDMVPVGVSGNAQPVVVDGAKRDRLIWSGDLAIEGPTIYDSLGSKGSDYVKQSLALLLAAPALNGGVATTAPPDGSYRFNYSASYQMYTVDDVVAYYRATGDAAFADEVLPALQNQLVSLAGQVDSRGLLITTSTGGQLGYGDGADWDIYDGGKGGAVTEYNALYFHTLTEMAYLEAHRGNQAQADNYGQQATALKTAINASLFNATTGVYDLSDQERGTIAEDANAAAVLYGVAPSGQAAGILNVLKRSLWTPSGSEPFSANTGFSSLISPYINGLDVEARFASGDTSDAVALMLDMWGQMVQKSGPYYTGAFWEKLNSDGTLPDSETSLAHGWASAPTSALSDYVLGVQAVDPGYASWLVQPHPGTLSWAEGQVPSPDGNIAVKWAQNRAGASFTLQVDAPARTSGTIAVPAYGRTTVFLDGRLAWNGTEAKTDSAYEANGYVYLTGIRAGSHTVTAVPAE